MAEFPTDFTENAPIIRSTEVWPKHSVPFAMLENSGLVVLAGLAQDDVPALTEIASQSRVVEYCPNDIRRRWTDVPTARKQLAKDGGRAVFQLVEKTTGWTAGFGWTGASSEEEREFLPDCENTFALRMSENFRGRKLAVPFSKAIVAASMQLYGARRIGLETWGSNTAAVRTYLGAGAVLVTTKSDKRPTLVEANQDAYGNRHDVRLYMKYAQSM